MTEGTQVHARASGRRAASSGIAAAGLGAAAARYQRASRGEAAGVRLAQGLGGRCCALAMVTII